MNLETIHIALPGGCDDLAGRLAATALAGLGQAEVAELSRRYDEALAGPRTEENEITLLLTRPFSTRLDIPEYYRYTGLHVFGWFLADQDEVFGACLLATHATLDELSKIEQLEARRHEVVPDLTAERLRCLDHAIGLVVGMAVAPRDPLRGADLVERALGDERLRRRLLVLTRCCGFRRSDKYDEHIFIRSVQACELVFYMIRWTARQAVAAAGTDRDEALFRMGQANACADLLTAIFRALRTLTPELFLGFRDETGDASAVQSLNYHLMELVVYGYDERKAETYRRFAHLGQVDDQRLRRFRSLQDTALASGDAELVATFAGLEQRLLAWRGKHYGFGRTYLPNMKGSGGTEGAGYLKRFVHKTGFSSGPLVEDPERLLSSFAFC